MALIQNEGEIIQYFLTIRVVAQMTAIQQHLNVRRYHHYLCRIIGSKVEKSLNHHSGSYWRT